MDLRTFQRRLRDCPVVRIDEAAAITLEHDMVNVPLTEIVARASGGHTRLVPRGVVYGVALVDAGLRAAELLAKGELAEAEHKQIAIYRHILTPEEWSGVERAASLIPSIQTI